ncbi:hypothetical protein PVK06_003298 [Gossypium arboreum]|uniref:Uncharacterized protein n=1 Tax=Gossypium arboreum TaxID=29729 RepID=A0ABR0R756_GOSAR|nr:hypothetical protein PVK06_003298 [Gossypium arboreum]
MIHFHRLSKSNCDAAFLNQSEMSGIAAITRNSNREIVDGINELVFASSALVAEALAFKARFLQSYSCEKMAECNLKSQTVKTLIKAIN